VVRDATAWRKVPFALLLGALLLFGISPKTLTEKIKPSAQAILGMAIKHAKIVPPAPRVQPQVAAIP